MAKATFNITSLVYSDTTATNDPQLRDFDWHKKIEVDSMPKLSVQRLVLPTGDSTITIPVDPSSFAYIETDQTIKLKFNGSTETVVDVSPSAAGTNDGVFFKRGAYTSLTINVPGATSANITIFLGV